MLWLTLTIHPPWSCKVGITIQEFNHLVWTHMTCHFCKWKEGRKEGRCGFNTFSYTRICARCPLQWIGKNWSYNESHEVGAQPPKSFRVLPENLRLTRLSHLWWLEKIWVILKRREYWEPKKLGHDFQIPNIHEGYKIKLNRMTPSHNWCGTSPN